MSTDTAKKAYRRPRLTRYGRVEALTTGQSGAGKDGMSGMPGKA